MSKLLKNQKLREILLFLKPWMTVLVVIVVLRYTGLLSGISVFAQSTLLETGIMDIKPENNPESQFFNYQFTMKDMKGNEVNMADYKGKVIFLNLWATWCGPCRAEMPSIQELYDKVDHEKIVFVMLSLDIEEHQPKILKYVAEKSFTFPVYQPFSSLPKQMQVSTIPTTFVVAPDGKIKMRKKGMSNYATEDFQKFLEGLAEAPQEK